MVGMYFISLPLSLFFRNHPLARKEENVSNLLLLFCYENENQRLYKFFTSW
jgi:hypothetical protein